MPVWYMHAAMSIGAGMKSWTLSGRCPVRFKIEGQLDRRRQVAARMAGDEIRDQMALLSRGGRGAAELLLEGGEGLDRRLRHQRQRRRIAVFRRDLEQSAGVMLGQFVDVLAAPQGEVHAHARRHEDLLHAGLPPRLPHQLDQRRVVGPQQRADRRMEATRPAALAADLRPRAVHLVHVRRRPADVADDAGKIRRRRPCGGSPPARTPGCGFE